MAYQARHCSAQERPVVVRRDAGRVHCIRDVLRSSAVAQALVSQSLAQPRSLSPPCCEPDHSPTTPRTSLELRSALKL